MSHLSPIGYGDVLIIRVRFARLSRLKIILGCPPDEVEYPEFDWRNLVEDDEYLVLDLVLNWVSTYIDRADVRSRMACYSHSSMRLGIQIL